MGTAIAGFLKAYVKSMRLYYAFVTGIGGWLGLSFYEHIALEYPSAMHELPDLSTKLIILALVFLSWGINQIINDYLGLKEDRINAPERPMVTGQLPPGPALGLSFFFLALTGAFTWFYLQPAAIIPLILGVSLNVLYEYAKGHGLWGLSLIHI